MRRTAQALLAFPPQDQNWHRAIDARVSGVPILIDFADALDGCRSLEAAWRAMLSHVEGLGASFTSLAVIAEPAGQLTNGTKLVATTMPDEVLQLYKVGGGVSTDPVAQYMSAYREETFMASAPVLTAMLTKAPRPLRDLIEITHDLHLLRLLVVPGRDEATGAPYGTVLAFERKAAADVEHRSGEHVDILKAVQQMFWRFLQQRRLLTKFVDLSGREREALTLAARGFTSSAAAEQMGVSVRAVEKTLATARARLGASTTAAALYRAMVYRALD